MKEVPKPSVRCHVMMSDAHDRMLTKVEFALRMDHGLNVSRSFILDHVLRNVDPKALAKEIAKA